MSDPSDGISRMRNCRQPPIYLDEQFMGNRLKHLQKKRRRFTIFLSILVLVFTAYIVNTELEKHALRQEIAGRRKGLMPTTQAAPTPDDGKSEWMRAIERENKYYLDLSGSRAIIMSISPSKFGVVTKAHILSGAYKGREASFFSDESIFPKDALQPGMKVRLHPMKHNENSDGSGIWDMQFFSDDKE